MRYFIIASILFLFQFLAKGQCDCQDCPVNLPAFGGDASMIDISGATNPTLGQNGQDLRSVTISLEHDDISDLDISIVSPNGGTIDLSRPSSSAGLNVLYNICFLACGETADPDPGFPENFDSGAGYLSNETYTGSYYPIDDLCFEIFSGPVNGEWRLQINDSDVGGWWHSARLEIRIL